MEEKLAQVTQKLVEGNAEELQNEVQGALDQGVSAENVMNNALVAGMDTVGQRWKAGDMFIPEVIRSAKAMSGAMDIIRPKLAANSDNNLGTFVIGTVLRDLHDIGKDLTSMMLEGAGFTVVDLGVDNDADVFVEAVKENQAQILGLSALLTTTMDQMGQTIDALKEAGIRDQVKVMVGGAPVTEEFAEEIGADAYGPNAADAVQRAKELATAG